MSWLTSTASRSHERRNRSCCCFKMVSGTAQLRRSLVMSCVTSSYLGSAGRLHSRALASATDRLSRSWSNSPVRFEARDVGRESGGVEPLHREGSVLLLLAYGLNRRCLVAHRSPQRPTPTPPWLQPLLPTRHPRCPLPRGSSEWARSMRRDELSDVVSRPIIWSRVSGFSAAVSLPSFECSA